MHLLTSTTETLSTYLIQLLDTLTTRFQNRLVRYFIRVYKENLCDPISHFGREAYVTLIKIAEDAAEMLLVAIYVSFCSIYIYCVAFGNQVQI